MDPLTFRTPVVVSHVFLYRYDLPLTAPLQLGGEEVRRREGLLVRILTEAGDEGWGEAAPLPGFSREELSEVVAHARRVLSRWPGVRIPASETDLKGTLQRLPVGTKCPASLHFAMDSAVLELIAMAADNSVATVLGATRPTIELNALIPHSETGVARRAALLQEEGYRALKVKVGGSPVEDDIARVQKIREVIDPDVDLRLDANRAWSLEQAVVFAEGLSGLDVAYVEEPLADPEMLDDLVARTGLPVALDETTREVMPVALRRSPSVSAVVLKPMLLGGLSRVRAWCEAARETGATPVLSAAYESGVGLRMLVALAAAGPETPVGLSTYGRLAADVHATRLSLGGPRVHVASVTPPAAPRIDQDRLELVDRFSD